ncbi:hypothetical protein HaLaN_32253, partial [Haematococcus lacustris]
MKAGCTVLLLALAASGVRAQDACSTCTWAVRMLDDALHQLMSSRSSRTWRAATCTCSSSADCLLPEGAPLSPTKLWRMCWPSTRVSTPASTLYLAMSTTPTRSVQGKVVTWLEGQEQGQGGVVPTVAMRDEVVRQRRLLGLGQGVVVNDAWLERGCNRGNLLRHAVDISRQLKAANVSWKLDWAVWQAAGGQRNTRPYRPPSPFAPTPSCSCKAHHIKLDTQALLGLMRTAGMLPADITSLPKFTSGVAGPKDTVRPNVGQKFAQVVHTDGVAISVMFIRPKPAEPPDKLPCMGKEEGA